MAIVSNFDPYANQMLEKAPPLASKRAYLNPYDVFKLWETIAIEMSRQRKQDGDLYSSEDVIKYATAVADAYKDYATKLS